ncbi:MAG: BatA and WFA domain-containing protein [Bryobacterales bacterium]|nr:BatA and WFA domain-containing protein [Bryobacterales bacterium]
MGFLAPLFLAGLVGIGLPVWLHLLRKQQETPVPFATLMFLEKTEQRHTRKKQLRYLMLFSLRALIVLLLALIFAQPFYREPLAVTQSSRLVVLGLDASLSMQRGGLAEAARGAALEVVNANAGKAMQVISFAHGASLLTEVTNDADKVRDAIRSWKPGASSGSFAELAQAATSIHTNEKKPLDLHVISDLQASAMPASFDESKLPPGTALTAHPVGAANQDNLSIDAVDAPARVAPASKVLVRAVLASYAEADREVPVGLYFDDRKVASTTVKLRAGERGEAAFDEVEPGPRWTRAEVRIESEDALPQDNRFAFAIEKTDLQTVAFVSGATVNLSAKYMETALAAIPNTLYRFQMLAPGQLTEENVRTFAYVVVDAGTGVFPAIAADLSRFVRSGGAVWILLPRNATPGTAIPLVETTLRSASQGAERGELRLDTLAQAHPVLEGLDGLRSIRFLSAWNVEEEGLEVLARLGDRTPVLLEKRLGDGRILVLTSALDSASNDIPFHPIFVPFVERVSRYLSGLTARTASRRVDDFFEIRAPGATGAAAGYEVTSPSGTRLVSRSESLDTDGVLLEEPGFYKVERVGGREELVAANAGARESNLARMDDAQLALWKQSGGDAVAADQAAASPDSQRRVPFGWYGFLLLAGVLMAESIVANRFWRRSSGDEL